MQINFITLSFNFFLFVTFGTTAQQLSFKFPSLAFGEDAFLEYVKSRAHFDAFVGLPANGTIKFLFQKQCQCFGDYSAPKFNEHLASKFDTQLAVLHLMHKHWHCAGIGADIGTKGQELCSKFSANLNTVYEFILNKYIEGADPSLAAQLAPAVKPKFEAKGHLQTMGELIEIFSNFSTLFFTRQKIEAFDHFSKIFLREWGQPNLMNNAQIKFAHQLGRLRRNDRAKNSELNGMAEGLRERLRKDPFLDTFGPAELRSKLYAFDTMSNGQVEQPIEEKEKSMMREMFDKKLAEIAEKVKEQIERLKNQKEEDKEAPFEDKFRIYLSSPFADPKSE